MPSACRDILLCTLLWSLAEVVIDAQKRKTDPSHQNVGEIAGGHAGG